MRILPVQDRAARLLSNTNYQVAEGFVVNKANPYLNV